MIIKPPEFSKHFLFYGQRTVVVDLEPGDDLKRVMSEIVKAARYPSLILLKGDPWAMPDLEDMIRLGKTKAYQFALMVDCDLFSKGALPAWCDHLTTLVLEIPRPERFDYADRFNTTVQDFWFMDGELVIVAHCHGPADLDMLAYICTLTPNDLRFYVVGHHHQSILRDRLHSTPHPVRFVDDHFQPV